MWKKFENHLVKLLPDLNSVNNRDGDQLVEQAVNSAMSSRSYRDCFFAYALEQTVMIKMLEIAMEMVVRACLCTAPRDNMCYLGNRSILQREREKQQLLCSALQRQRTALVKKIDWHHTSWTLCTRHKEIPILHSLCHISSGLNKSITVSCCCSSLWFQRQGSMLTNRRREKPSIKQEIKKDRDRLKVDYSWFVARSRCVVD